MKYDAAAATGTRDVTRLPLMMVRHSAAARQRHGATLSAGDDAAAARAARAITGGPLVVVREAVK